MGTDDRLRVLQIYNISTAATNDLIKQLFQHFGRIDEFQVYPVLVTAQTTQKVAYVRYEKEKSVLVAQHMTNTVFFDRAMICVPTTTNTIPDEETALLNSAGLGKRVLPAHVMNKVEENEHGQKMLYTTDPTLTNLGLLPYPPLGAELDPEIVEQTRRTLYVGNLKKDVDPDDVVKFFNTIGEVMYLRMANINEHHSCAYAYVEFTNQTSVPQALQNDGVEFQGQPIRIQHSRVAIVKPQQKTDDQALEEIEEAIRRRDKGEPSPRRRTTRSPSPIRSRRRSRTPPRRSRSRGRDRDRDRDSRKRDDRRDRDKDRRDRKDDKSRKDDRESSRKDDRESSRKDRDKEKEKEIRRSRSPIKEKEDKKERERKKEKSDEKTSERSKDREREKRGKDMDRDRDSKKRDDRRDRDKDRKDDKSRKDDRESSRKDRDKEKKKERRRSRSPRKEKHDKKERERKREKSVEKTSEPSKDREKDIELSIRERLLAKKMKRSRGSDEMEISD
uniref:RRM domain-containing protein n=1 Tax=Panagrolaimus sp. ES5 TaxID=591445 RepID=A0AC34F4V7_9BILA